MTRARAALALAALALAALAPGAAAAPPTYTVIDGGCEFLAVDPDEPAVAPPGTFTGTMEAAAVAYSPTPDRNPVTWEHAVCELYVDGDVVVAAPATTAGPLAVVPPTPIRYAAGPTTFVELCLRFSVVNALGQRDAGLDCYEGAPGKWWEDWLVDEAGVVFGAVNDLWAGEVEPPLCALLAGQAGAPGGGVVTVDEQGDVYVAGELFWDCPPYW